MVPIDAETSFFVIVVRGNSGIRRRLEHESQCAGYAAGWRSADSAAAKNCDAGACREHHTSQRPIRRFSRLPAMPRCDLRALVATRMANIITDPKVNPRVVLGDFSKPNPLVIQARRRGVRLRHEMEAALFHSQGQRLLPGERAVGRDEPGMAAVLPPAQHRVVGDSLSGCRRGQHRAADGPLCDGCHSTNYNVQTKQTTEWNVGCERCHGPGGAHVARPSRANIIDPSRLDYVSANDTCIQCHSQGQPLQNPLPARYTIGRSAFTWVSS